MLYLILTIVVIFILLRLYSNKYWESIYWCWDDGMGPPAQRKHISLDQLTFPRNFLWGTASAAHQVEGGHTNNNWSWWETQKDAQGQPRIKHDQKCGEAVQHWSRYPEDITLMQELGTNAYRFSISWDKLQPKRGEWHIESVKHYHDVIDALLAKNIVPMLTLHHFTQPLWFDEMGGFEEEKNIPIFVEFCEKAFKEWGTKVKYWCTINEPEVYVTFGWSSGLFPPGKKDSPVCGRVMANLLKSHVAVYHALKKLPQGTHVQIGIVKDIFQFDAASPLNPLDVFLARMIDQAFNECILEFFRSGEFSIKMPNFSEKFSDPTAPNTNDFVGLNYYSNFLVRCTFNPAAPFEFIHPRGHVMTDMTQTVYGEGLYRALKRTATLKKPIFVTENGIADHADDRRYLYLRRYIYAMNKAMQEGVDVRGYFYWSLTDNFEWAEGYDMRFGLYHVDLNTQKRTLRHGSKFYRWLVRQCTNQPMIEEDAAQFAMLAPPTIVDHMYTKDEEKEEKSNKKKTN